MVRPSAIAWQICAAGTGGLGCTASSLATVWTVRFAPSLGFTLDPSACPAVEPRPCPPHRHSRSRQLRADLWRSCSPERSRRVIYSEAMSAWVVSQYHDARTVLTDRAASAAKARSPRSGYRLRRRRRSLSRAIRLTAPDRSWTATRRITPRSAASSTKPSRAGSSARTNGNLADRSPRSRVGRTPSGLTATCRQIGRIRERASHGVDHWELSVSAGGLGTACPCDLYR
jgi:hypothetical protein